MQYRRVSESRRELLRAAAVGLRTSARSWKRHCACRALGAPQRETGPWSARAALELGSSSLHANLLGHKKTRQFPLSGPLSPEGRASSGGGDAHTGHYLGVADLREQCLSFVATTSIDGTLFVQYNTFLLVGDSRTRAERSERSASERPEHAGISRRQWPFASRACLRSIIYWCCSRHIRGKGNLTARSPRVKSITRCGE